MPGDRSLKVTLGSSTPWAGLVSLGLRLAVVASRRVRLDAVVVGVFCLICAKSPMQRSLWIFKLETRLTCCLSSIAIAFRHPRRGGRAAAVRMRAPLMARPGKRPLTFNKY
jgi:hypothetical protein